MIKQKIVESRHWPSTTSTTTTTGICSRVGGGEQRGVIHLVFERVQLTPKAICSTLSNLLKVKKRS